MAEFSLDIPINADLSPFRAQLKAELELAAKGVAVPVSAGRGVNPAGGGQYAPAGIRVSPAEQAAVDRAFARVNATGSSFAQGGGPGGGTLSPKIDTNEAQIGLRRIRGIFDELKQYIERTPIRVNLDTGGAGIAGVRGGGGGGGVPTSITRGGRVSAARFAALAPGGGESQNPLLIGTTDWEAELAQYQAGLPVGAVARDPSGFRNRGGRGGTAFGALRGARSIVGILAVTELANAAQAIREGESQAGMARTREEAQLARAMGIERGTSGLLGSAFAFIPNALDLAGSPQRMLREASEAVDFRRREDERRAGRFGVAGDQAYRSGYSSGGQGFAEISRARVQATEQADTQNRRARELRAPADERTPIVETWASAGMGGQSTLVTSGGGYVLGSEARLSNLADASAAEESAKNVLEQQEFGERRFNVTLNSARLASINAVGRLKMISRRASSRDIERQGIRDRYNERMASDFVQFGEVEGERRNTEEKEAAVGAFDYANRKDDRMTGARRLLGMGLRGIQQVGNAFVAARQLTNQQAQLAQIIARNPAVAAGLGVSADVEDQLRATQNLPFGVRQLVQSGISGLGEQRKQLIARQFAEDRFEQSEGLDAANRQSRFRQAGGNYGVDAALDKITSDTARDARRYEQEGDPRNAVKRRTLGVNQIRETRDDFFRSINFEEVSGGRIAAGRGNPFAGVDKKFNDAEDRIGKSKEAGSPENQASLLEAIKGILEQIRDGGIPATAG